MHKWNHFSFNPWRIPPSQLVDAIGLQAWKLSLWFGSGCKKNTPTPEIGSTKINPFFFFVFFLDVSRFAHRGEKNYILNSNEHIHFFFHSCYVNFYFVYLFLYPFFSLSICVHYVLWGHKTLSTPKTNTTFFSHFIT